MQLQQETLSDLKYQVYLAWKEQGLLRASQIDIMADRDGAGGLRCHAQVDLPDPTPVIPESLAAQAAAYTEALLPGSGLGPE